MSKKKKDECCPEKMLELLKQGKMEEFMKELWEYEKKKGGGKKK